MHDRVPTQAIKLLDNADVGHGGNDPNSNALLALPANSSVEELALTFAAKSARRLQEVLASIHT